MNADSGAVNGGDRGKRAVRGRTLRWPDPSDRHAGARESFECLESVYAGGIPGYTLDPNGVAEKNAIFYKTLAPGG